MNKSQAIDNGAAVPPGLASQPDVMKRRTVMLGMLVLIYTSNFIDRTILATLAQAIKVDLRISDTQLGLLQGLAFAIFYTGLGIPLARLSERMNRVSLISVCLVIWSGMTALSGFAANYMQLFLCRVLVGVGEAGCSPPAHSLISDLYERGRRATALAVYSFGIPLGTMIGAMSGGWLAQEFGWRMAFVVVGLPGILIAILFRLIGKEPVRGGADTDGIALPVATEAAPGIIETAKHLFGDRAFLHITIGATVIAFVAYGTGTFTQAYFIRMFDLTYAEVGLAFGLVGGLAAGLGTLLGGVLGDWAGKRSQVWYSLLPAVAFLIATPGYIVAFTRDEWGLALACFFLPAICHYAYIGPTLGVMHNLATARMRATATALFFVFVNLIGLGIGPYVTGAAIDFASNLRFATSDFGEFLTACPGGIAPAGAGADLATACHDASAYGTRDGIVGMTLLFFWGAIHYFLAARHMGWLKGTRRDSAGSRQISG